MSTIQDVRDCGFEVGVASGDVETEHQALAEAVEQRDPDVLAEQTALVTKKTVEDLNAIGTLPDSPDERRAVAEQIASTVLDALIERADARVEFHERAVEEAKKAPTHYVVSGHGVENLYVTVNDETGEGWDESAQSLLDGLCKVPALARKAK